MSLLKGIPESAIHFLTERKDFRDSLYIQIYGRNALEGDLAVKFFRKSLPDFLRGAVAVHKGRSVIHIFVMDEGIAQRSGNGLILTGGEYVGRDQNSSP